VRGAGRLHQPDVLWSRAETGLPHRGLPIGHGAANVLVSFGTRVRLDGGAGRLTFLEPAVAVATTRVARVQRSGPACDPPGNWTSGAALSTAVLWTIPKLTPDQVNYLNVGLMLVPRGWPSGCLPAVPVRVRRSARALPRRSVAPRPDYFATGKYDHVTLIG
jgi:hypothetical protein